MEYDIAIFFGFRVFKLWQFHFKTFLDVESSKIVTLGMKLLFV